MRETHNIVHDIAKRKAHLHVIKQSLVMKGANDMATKIYVNSFAMAASASVISENSLLLEVACFARESS